jgi:hypothetical protein
VTAALRSRPVDWFLRSRESGRITLVQLPNRWLVAWGVLRLAQLLLPSHDSVRWAATVALAVWAVLEVRGGVNPFRRLLGLVVLGFVVTSAW